MEVTFKNKKLERSITTQKGLLKTYNQSAKRVKMRYDQLRASATLADMGKIRGAKLHPLSGDREGQWAVTITGPQRLCFILVHDPVPTRADGGVDTSKVTNIQIVYVGDYH